MWNRTLSKSSSFRYIRDFEGTLSDDGSEESDQQYVDRLVGNPIHAFNLMRRFTVDIPSLEKDLREDDWKGKQIMTDNSRNPSLVRVHCPLLLQFGPIKSLPIVFGHYMIIKRMQLFHNSHNTNISCHEIAESSGVIQKLRLGSAVPKETDLHGAAQALIRLQDVYELDIAEVFPPKAETVDGAAVMFKNLMEPPDLSRAVYMIYLLAATFGCSWIFWCWGRRLDERDRIAALNAEDAEDDPYAPPALYRRGKIVLDGRREELWKSNLDGRREESGRAG